MSAHISTKGTGPALAQALRRRGASHLLRLRGLDAKLVTPDDGLRVAGGSH